jgi:predicted phage tail protein
MSQITSSAARTITTARSTQPKAELEDEGALVVVVTGCVVVVVVAWGWLVVVVGASVVEVVVAVVGGTVVVVGGAVVVVAGGTVVVVVCAVAPPADSPRAKRTANTAKSPVHVAVRRNMVAQPRDRAPTKRGTVGRCPVPVRLHRG